MSSMDPRQLVDYLWPNGDSLSGPQVHLLVDGARCPDAVSLIRHGKLEYGCLFSGRLTPRLQAAAPYLVHLAAASPLTLELLSRTWGNSGGILTVARADVTLDQQRRHFKKFLRVQDEGGRVLQFRFYDPRVLRIYLPTCTMEELQRFFGPVTRIVMEAQDSAMPHDYALQHGALVPGRNAAVAEADGLRALRRGLPAQDTAPLAAPGRGPEALDIAALGLHHVETYRRLQNDEDIRRWTGLPLHASVEDARRWIRQQLERSDTRICVIRHPDHGIVGALALEQQGAAALGYCWIGKQYQRRGYGQAAMRLLREFAAGRGVRQLYSALDADNVHALKLVQRAGAVAAGEAQLGNYCLPLRDAGGAARPDQVLR
jgi:RimJ/RimL family protein N-acetyltransferase